MKLKAVYLAVLLSFVFTKTSYAYLDPGTGSYVIQVTLGLLAGAFYILKIYWQRVVLFFSKKTPVQESEDSKSVNDDSTAQSSVDAPETKDINPSNE